MYANQFRMPVFLESLSIYIFVFCLLTRSQFLSQPSHQQSFSHGEFNSCFSQLSGPVEESCPAIENIHQFNLEYFHSLITELVKRPYFRYYQTNLTRKCRFWEPVETCTMPDCELECCEDTEVPAYQIHTLCSHDIPELLGAINNTLTPSQTIEMSQWEEIESAGICFEDQQGLQEDQFSSFYDLQSNREQYTAYKGADAAKVWKSIYKENCFLPPGVNTSYKLNRIFTERSLAKLCLEKRAFYRLISGLHASISLHICEYWKYTCGVFGKEDWNVNLNEFYRRFSPNTTRQQGPVWLKNMYFTFLVELYALSQAETDLSLAVFYTGKSTHDAETQELVTQLLSLVRNAQLVFDPERVFFAELEHIWSIRDAFANITRIMDCVSCQRCRLWGSLQSRAIATSLKILLNSHLSSSSPSYPSNGGLLRNLARGEIVALFNGLAQLSKSLYFIETHKQLFP